MIDAIVVDLASRRENEVEAGRKDPLATKISAQETSLEGTCLEEMSCAREVVERKEVERKEVKRKEVGRETEAIETEIVETVATVKGREIETATIATEEIEIEIVTLTGGIGGEIDATEMTGMVERMIAAEKAKEVVGMTAERTISAEEKNGI